MGLGELAYNDQKIAIVDDEQDILELASKIVEKLGYSPPATFRNGSALVTNLMRNDHSFDVIIMDYQMPEMDGIEAAKIIQRYKKGTKIIIASGYDFVKEKAVGIGAMYLAKPFSIRQLAQCLAAMQSAPPIHDK